MYNEIRLSPRQAIVIGIITFMAFVYAWGRNSCEDSSVAVASSSRGEDNLPIIYAVTPTYYRPVQKAELTRYVKMHFRYFIWW